MTPWLSIGTALISMVLFYPAVKIMDSTRAWTPTLAVAVPAVLLTVISMVIGVRVLQQKPSGGRYGAAMVGTLSGAFSSIFWVIMVPMLLIVALPARELDAANPEIEQSRKQMRILVRQVKSFHHDFGRLPVRLKELVDKGYIETHLLYDPRQRRRDAPSYRLMVDVMPPEDRWATSPFIEGRIPDEEGFRLLVYPDETTGTIR